MLESECYCEDQRCCMFSTCLSLKPPIWPWAKCDTDSQTELQEEAVGYWVFMEQVSLGSTGRTHLFSYQEVRAEGVSGTDGTKQEGKDDVEKPPAKSKKESCHTAQPQSHHASVFYGNLYYERRPSRGEAWKGALCILSPLVSFLPKRNQGSSILNLILKKGIEVGTQEARLPGLGQS